MSIPVVEQRSMYVSQEHLLAFVRASLGGPNNGRPDDEHPLPHGPWDPHIRTAINVARAVDPKPVPWRGFEAGRASVFLLADEVELNPQPLPPRYRFLTTLAQLVIERAGLLQEVADAMADDGARRGIIVVGGYASRFADDWCGNGFRPRWPFPSPPPPWWTRELDGFDLMVMATQFQQAGREAFTGSLRESFSAAGRKFAEVGFARVQSA